MTPTRQRVHRPIYNPVGSVASGKQANAHPPPVSERFPYVTRPWRSDVARLPTSLGDPADFAVFPAAAILLLVTAPGQYLLASVSVGSRLVLVQAAGIE